MTRKIVCSFIAAVTLAMTPVAAMAEDQTGENLVAGAEGTSESAVAKAALAQELFAHAQETKNAVAALAAAQIMLSLDFKDETRESEQQDVEGEMVADDNAGAEAPADGAAMLAAAKEYAGGDEAMLGMIEDVEAEGSRGRIGGATRHLSRLPARKIDIFKIPFAGGRLAELAIVGDGDTNLDLLVTDQNGNRICYDRSYSDKLYCSWTPRWDGYFVIAVANQGRIRNSYYLLTN